MKYKNVWFVTITHHLHIVVHPQSLHGHRNEEIQYVEMNFIGLRTTKLIAYI